MISFRFVYSISIYFAIFSNVSFAAAIATAADIVKVNTDVFSNSLDEQLYSRQIFVYGKSAQQSLSSSHVLVRGSNGPLAAEIVKNLALAGVGRLSIMKEFSSKDSSTSIPNGMLSGDESLIEYVRSLNPLVVVDELFTASEAPPPFTVAVCAESKMETLKAVAAEYRSLGIKHIGCNVLGVCGFVCDDFMEGFEVLDSDGEVTREIPLLNASITKSDGNNENNEKISIESSLVEMKVSCIDEERLGLGLGDFAELISTSDYGSWKVLKVENSKTVVMQSQTSITDDFKLLNIIEGIKQGKVNIKKMKLTNVLNHSPLSDHLGSNPSFIPTNGCLSDKKDKALSLCLLAAFKIIDNIPVTTFTEELNSFSNLIIKELVSMGVADPLKSIKEGGVGRETIEYISEKFLYSGRKGGKCPATVSIIGAIASQEAIKAITHIHVPISQLLMFESLDSILLPLKEDVSDVSCGEKSPVGLVYGGEVAAELASMKVFIVGSGAIGCELLKTFALLGVGCGSSPSGLTPADGGASEPQEGSGVNGPGEGLWEGLSDGGIVLADMDQIERSNLNRQLLFREEHVGMAKAVVAAETVKKINPKMRVRAAEYKLCTESEAIFDSAFWNDVDVVTTALDNIDARRYIDSRCVGYCTWMVDSGTLGTKGNTQVVIPYISESYSSSADPPEEDIPLCTLKSFPYQPEHCVSWARNKFDQLFNQDIKLLESCLNMQSYGDTPSRDAAKHDTEVDVETVEIKSEGGEEMSGSGDAIWSSLKALMLSSDDISRLLAALKSSQVTHKSVVEWAVRTFDSTYRVDAKQLLKEHPAGEVDSEGVSFWGGSRRRPTPLIFDAADGAHRSFVMWAAVLRGRACGLRDLKGPDDPLLLAAYNELAGTDIGMTDIDNGETESQLGELLISMGTMCRQELLVPLNPQVFEKDDASLGHVDFATAAANLRSF